MTLVHLYLFNRYKVRLRALRRADRRQRRQCERMKAWGIYSDRRNEVGAIIVAQVDQAAVTLADRAGDAVAKLIRNANWSARRPEA